MTTPEKDNEEHYNLNLYLKIIFINVFPFLINSLAAEPKVQHHEYQSSPLDSHESVPSISHSHNLYTIIHCNIMLPFPSWSSNRFLYKNYPQ